MKPLLAVALAAIAMLAPACRTDAAGADRALVAASFYPLEWIAQQVGGGAIEVAEMTPPGVEPHDLELTPSQVKTLAQADLVLFIGGGFQPAVEDIALEDPESALDTLAASDLLTADGTPDPHVWLDPLRFIDVVDLVSDALTDRFPAHGARFRDSAAELSDDLRTLDSDIESGLADCERREIVTSHDAFGYLADRYGLDQVPISGVSPEGEPSPQRVAEVATLARSLGVTTIFFETLVSPDVAETIASEIGLEVAVLDPIETKPADGDYIDAMRSNLATLRDALGCR